jgi:hypothetical protein
VTSITAQVRWTSYFLTIDEADHPFVEQQGPTKNNELLNNELLNDEQLSMVAGGGKGNGLGGINHDKNDRPGTGTGHGDSLGWLRDVLHSAFGINV